MFSERTISYEDMIAKGNKVVTRFDVRSSHTGDVEGFPATGKKIEIKGIEIVQFENGKIVESWEAVDELGIYKQLGFELKPPEVEK